MIIMLLDGTYVLIRRSSVWWPPPRKGGWPRDRLQYGLSDEHLRWNLWSFSSFCLKLVLQDRLPAEPWAGGVYRHCASLHSKIPGVVIRHIFEGNHMTQWYVSWKYEQVDYWQLSAIWSVGVTWTAHAMSTGFASAGSPPWKYKVHTSGWVGWVEVNDCKLIKCWDMILEGRSWKVSSILIFPLFLGMLRRGFTDDDLFNSSFDSQLPEPHIVALLHKALLYLVPYLVLINSNVTRINSWKFSQGSSFI